MSESFHFETVEILTVGTLGPKGQRVFYLQCLAEGELVSLKFEKQQAAAEARLEDLLQRVSAAAHALNVCALNLQSAEAVFRRGRLWFAIGVCAGLALATLIGPYWPW